MHDLEQQPSQDGAAATQMREGQPVIISVEKQKTEIIAGKSRQAHVWRYSIPGGIVLLVLAIIFVGVLSTDHQTRTPPHARKQPTPTVPLPVSQPFAVPTPTTTPLQTSGAPSHSLSTSLVDGVAYIGTANNVVYALRMSNGTKLWQQQIDGAVDQSPLVLNGVVYVNSFVGQNGPDSIYALRASDGRVLWHLTPGDNGLTNNYTYLSSAASDSNTLYLVSQEGVAALQASSGQVIWHFATQGAGDSMPIVDNGIVYATSSADGKPGTLDALRASDGKLLWQHTEGTYLSVSVISNSIVYLTSNRAITALRASNGSTLWQRAIDADIIQQPQLVNGVIYAAGTKITLPPAALHILPSQHVTALSELTRTVPTRPAMPLKEGASTVYAIRANDGTMLWHYPLLNGANSLTSWLFAQNGMVYVGVFTTNTSTVDDGEIYALQSQNGAVIWHDKVQASPDNALLANGVIYLNANNNLQNSTIYALRADTGALLWSYPVNGSIYTAPVLTGTVLSTGSDNGTFYALHADSGILLWHFQTNVGA